VPECADTELIGARKPHSRRSWSAHSGVARSWVADGIVVAGRPHRSADSSAAGCIAALQMAWPSFLWLAASAAGGIGHSQMAPQMTAYRRVHTETVVANRIAYDNLVAARPYSNSPQNPRHSERQAAEETDRAPRIALAQGGCNHQCCAGCRPWTASLPTSGRSIVPLLTAWRADRGEYRVCSWPRRRSAPA